MTKRQQYAAALVALMLGLPGCGHTTPEASQELDATGTVTNVSGAPVKDVEIQFQATGGTARQASFKLGADGKFAGKMTAGKYTYYFTELGGKSAALNRIPTDYRQGNMERIIEVKAGVPIEIKLP